MIRQLDFLSGFALRASRDARPMEELPGKPTVDPDAWISSSSRGKTREALQREPSLDDVLSDPIIRRLMSSDDVESSDLMRVMGKKQS